jgi:hypothetical protein
MGCPGIKPQKKRYAPAGLAGGGHVLLDKLVFDDMKICGTHSKIVKV